MVCAARSGSNHLKQTKLQGWLHKIQNEKIETNRLVDGVNPIGASPWTENLSTWSLTWPNGRCEWWVWWNFRCQSRKCWLIWPPFFAWANTSPCLSWAAQVLSGFTPEEALTATNRPCSLPTLYRRVKNDRLSIFRTDESPKTDRHEIGGTDESGKDGNIAAKTTTARTNNNGKFFFSHIADTTRALT